MTKTRKCAYCGKVFTTNSGMQKFCSEECAEQAKETKKKQQRDFLRAIEPVIKLQHQEYLTFSKAAILLGCTRQYVYKLVNQGKLPASRLSSRMSIIRKSDIEKMFEANPYNRILPCSKPKHSCFNRQGATAKSNAQKELPTDDVLEYYSGDEVMRTYKVKQSWLYTSAKRHQIPMCRISGRNYYSKKHVDAVFGKTIELASITEWVTACDVESLYSMKPTALRSYAHRHHIPTKREYGQTYYSKSHLDELRRTDLVGNDNYYTVEQVQQLYGLTEANICHIVKVKHITKIKVGRVNLLLRNDVERVMAERKAAGF